VLVGQAATTGQFMQPGLARDIVRTGGELIAPGAVAGQALRTAARAVPAVQAGAQTLGQRVTQQLGVSTPTQDVVLSALSGAGAEVGKETQVPGGELIGAFAAPIAGVGAQAALTKLISAGRSGIQALIRPFKDVSDDGAATLLAEAMVREGLSPDDVARRMAELGPEAIPADIGTSFARLLRTASNKIPRIEGSAAETFKARQSGQGDRLLGAFDDSLDLPTLNVDDEIARLNAVLKPQINKLYEDAGAEGIQLSERLRGLLEGESSIGKAFVKAQQRVADKRAAGDTITNIDLIDATKQELDDQIGKAIRKGAFNKSRDLIRLKNVMVEEADAAVPVYKEGRDLFAGKISLENAAQSGELFLKMKPRDMRDLTKTFGQSEKKMFKLGAKQAILDKIDDLQINADAVRRLFGKNGDVKKLRFLFDDEATFRKFSDTLKRESDFILTRRAAQANSTTAKQLSDDESAFEALGKAANAVSSPAQAASTINRLISGFGKGRRDADFVKALEEVGDILLIKGIEPARLQSILRRGSSKQVEAILRRALKKPTIKPFAPASITGGISRLDQREQ